MHKVVFKNYRGNLMKFVNKLSVISLIVLMFSFMNVANADNCNGIQAKSCEDFNKGMATDDEKARQCNNSWVPIASSESHGNQCKWGEILVTKPGVKTFQTKWTCKANDDEKCLATSRYK